VNLADLLLEARRKPTSGNIPFAKKEKPYEMDTTGKSKFHNKKMWISVSLRKRLALRGYAIPVVNPVKFVGFVHSMSPAVVEVVLTQFLVVRLFTKPIDSVVSMNLTVTVL